LGDCFETLLACSVPDLQLDLLPLNQNCLGFEIDSFIMADVPMVVMCDMTKVLAVNFNRMFVFPTPEFPIISSLAVRSRWDIVRNPFQRTMFI
jgi:hypothetical protein